jgi:hypothetical protein
MAEWSNARCQELWDQSENSILKMINMKTKYIVPFILIAVSFACTKSFEKFNTDVKSPATVKGEALFSKAELSLVDQISSTDVNLNVLKLYAQYWTETTYTDEANYDIVDRTISDNTFLEYFVGDASNIGGFLTDFKEAARLINTEQELTPDAGGVKQNKLAIIELLSVYAWQNLVDIFGNVPYTDALDINNIAPKYDDAATIYNDLLSRIDNAQANLDPASVSFGSADLIYNGDVTKWKLFANSLKLKLGINLADVNPTLSKTTIESAVAAGVFESSADDALLPYLGAIHTNPIYQSVIQSGRDDFIPANTIVDLMNLLLDPRRPFYFTLFNNQYVGGTYGESSPFTKYSHIASPISQPTFPGVLLTYYEVLFYEAEAVARGFAGGGTLSDLYNRAVTESIIWWGGTEADAAAYLAQPTVAYATAPGPWQQKIGTQEYIAFYTRGLEGWTEWRRLDYPVLNMPPSITSYDQIPKRMTYPINEQTLNKANYTTASQAIGGDLVTTRVFWDIH